MANTAKVLKEMDFRNFMIEGIDGEFSFLPKEPSDDKGAGSPCFFINTKTSNERSKGWCPSEGIWEEKQTAPASSSRATCQKTQKPPAAGSKATGEQAQPLEASDDDSDMHESRKSSTSVLYDDRNWGQQRDYPFDLSEYKSSILRIDQCKYHNDMRRLLKTALLQTRLVLILDYSTGGWEHIATNSYQQSRSGRCQIDNIVVSSVTMIQFYSIKENPEWLRRVVALHHWSMIRFNVKQSTSDLTAYLSCLLKEQLLEPALNLTIHCCGLEFRVLNGYDQKSFDEERGLN
ncbi:hypothetical protein Tco_0670544 [Tanacetum coccineum]